MLWMFAACTLLSTGAPEPEIVVVVRGDTLGKLAKTHHVTVADLKRWNGLDSDLIEVGQELKLFREGEETPVAAGPKPASSGKRRRRSTPGAADEDPLADEGEESEGPQVPNLPLPRAKACLAGPNGAGLGDEGAVASEGLSYDQAQRAMSSFLPKVGTCLVDLDPRPDQALDLAIHVGCDGRVKSVGIRNRGDWPQAHADCLVRAIERAPFPAHALPDGDTFHYPLRLQ